MILLQGWLKKEGGCEQPPSISSRHPCKQDSVNPCRSGDLSAIYLGPASPPCSSGLPVPAPLLPKDSRGPRDGGKCFSRKAFAPDGTYLALQPIRFTRPPCRHGAPWALTPHFHPYPGRAGTVIFCGTRCQVTTCAVTCLPVRKYGALRCPDFPPPHRAEAAEREAGRGKGTENLAM